MLRCADCEEVVDVKQAVPAGGARCTTFRCKLCHSARKAVRSFYVKSNRLQEWENMNIDQRRSLVIQNKNKGSGRGTKRKIYISETAECNDSLKLGQEKPFLTQKQLLDIIQFAVEQKTKAYIL